jgi:hypothetical protein
VVRLPKHQAKEVQMARKAPRAVALRLLTLQAKEVQMARKAKEVQMARKAPRAVALRLLTLQAKEVQMARKAPRAVALRPLLTARRVPNARILHQRKHPRLMAREREVQVHPVLHQPLLPMNLGTPLDMKEGLM